MVSCLLPYLCRYLKEMVQREEYIAKELLPTLMPPILRYATVPVELNSAA